MYVEFHSVNEPSKNLTFGFGFCSVLYVFGFGLGSGSCIFFLLLGSGSVHSCWFRVLSHL